MGLYRLYTLSALHPHSARHLQIFRRNLENLSVDLDTTTLGGLGGDVEKARKWKFAFLDLLVQMLVDEKGIGDAEVVDVLVYVEAVMGGFRGAVGRGGEGALNEVALVLDADGVVERGRMRG
jgi:hypothetical protein